jgi:hypothetical protein
MRDDSKVEGHQAIIMLRLKGKYVSTDKLDKMKRAHLSKAMESESFSKLLDPVFMGFGCDVGTGSE